jgi:hypothetical protein
VPRQVVVLFHDAHRLVHAVLFAFDRQTRVMQMRAHTQGVFQRPNIFVKGSEEGFYFSGDMYRASHPS